MDSFFHGPDYSYLEAITPDICYLVITELFVVASVGQEFHLLR